MNVLEEMIIDNVVEQLKSNRVFLLKYGIIKAGVGDEKHITPEIRRELWKQFVDTTEPLVSSFTRSLGALFIRQEEATLNNINLNPPPKEKKKWWYEHYQIKLTEEQQHFIDLWFNDRSKWEEEFMTIARPHIEGAIIAGGINALSNLDVTIPLNVTDTAILDYVKTQASRLSFEVNETTYNALRATLTEALQNGESVLQVRDRVQNIFHFSEKWRATRIAQTEMNGAVNKGAYEGNRQSGVVWGTQWIGALDDRIRDSHEELTVNETAVKLGDDFPIVDIPYPGCPDGAPEEIINCFIDGQTKVLTDKGWKKIRNIKPNDYVLTHKNRFQRVIRTKRIPRWSGEVVKIKLTYNQYISATPEHRFLMEDGNWKEIQNMQIGDNIQILASYCGYCGKLIPYWRKYCSFSCNSKNITERQWSNEEHRKNISEKATLQLNREYENGIRDKKETSKKARLTCFEKYGNGGYLGKNRNSKEFQNKINIGVIKKYGSHFEMLKKFAFVGLGKASFGGSKIEQSMKKYLDENEIACIPQFIIGRRRVDFYVPNEKIFIECDTKTYHSDMEKERKRDYEILMQYPDHQIAHVLYDTNSPEWKFYNLNMLNHSGTFQSISMQILSVERHKLKTPKTLFNFSVENDESYMIRGFYAHNCRCTTKPLTEGPNGEQPEPYIPTEVGTERLSDKLVYGEKIDDKFSEDISSVIQNGTFHTGMTEDELNQLAAVMNWGDKEIKLAEEIQNSIYNFTSFDFEGIRRVQFASIFGGEITEEMAKHYGREAYLTQKLAESNVLKGGRLFRGLSWENKEKFAEFTSAVKNGFIPLDAVSSFTKDFTIATSYSRDRTYHIFIELETSEGLKGLNIMELSKHPSEGEFILSANQKLKVSKYERTSDKYARVFVKPYLEKKVNIPKVNKIVFEAFNQPLSIGNSRG